MRVLFALIIFLGAIWIAVAARQQPMMVHAYGPDGVTKLHGYLK
jgi:hypothetical protein